MDIETLQAANKKLAELRKWQDVQTRLKCGNGFFQLRFHAHEVKTLPDKYESPIYDEKTIQAYTKFVDDMVKQCVEEFESIGKNHKV